MRISDWSSDVCSSDLVGGTLPPLPLLAAAQSDIQRDESIQLGATQLYQCLFRDEQIPFGIEHFKVICDALAVASAGKIGDRSLCRSGTNLRGDLFSKPRSEEHTSELQSLMRISYAVFCLKKKKDNKYETKQRNTENQIIHTPSRSLYQ